MTVFAFAQGYNCLPEHVFAVFASHPLGDEAVALAAAHGLRGSAVPDDWPDLAVDATGDGE